jgi:hypothetical protein
MELLRGGPSAAGSSGARSSSARGTRRRMASATTEVAEIATPAADGRAPGGQRAGHPGLPAGRPRPGPGYAPGCIGPTGSGSLQWPASSASRSTRPLLPRDFPFPPPPPSTRTNTSSVTCAVSSSAGRSPCAAHPIRGGNGRRSHTGGFGHPAARSSWARLLTYDCWSAPAHDRAEEARGCWPPRGGVGRRHALGPLRTTAPRRRRVLAVAWSC